MNSLINTKLKTTNSKVSYKLFRVSKKNPNQLFSLYVFSNESVPIGVWLNAKEGERVDYKSNKVKSKLGPLAFRPGWNSFDIPLVTHIGIKEDGAIKYMHPDTVWCEVEYDASVDYSEEALRNGKTKTGFDYRKACLSRVPVGGYYRFKTNPTMFKDWIISGELKVNRILSDEEVACIYKENGYEPLPRKERIDLREYGFVV